MTITSRLNPFYDVKLIADGKQHFYQIGEDEKWYPGVTTVLGIINKPALVQWASNSCSGNIKEMLLNKDSLLAEENKSYPKEILEYGFTEDQINKICEEGKNIYKKKAQEAADVGGRVHKAIDEIIKGNDSEIADDIKPGVEGFLKWKETHKLTIELGDTKLGSKLFGYGGSLDFVAFDGDEAILFDVKTTKKRRDRDHGAYDEYGLQLAAYCQAFQETYGIKVKEAYVLWVNKEKLEFKAVKVANIPLCLEGFLAALKLYQNSKIEKFEDGII